MNRHGQQGCRLCFVDHGPAANAIDGDEFRLVNDPGYWGAPDPVVLVLGQSKGRTQWRAQANDFDAVAFAGIRDRLSDILGIVGIPVGHDFGSRFTAEEEYFGFASLVRCSLSTADGKSSGSPVTRAMRSPQADRWVRTCMQRWLTHLNPRLRLVVLLGLSDDYVAAVVARIRDLHPSTFRAVNTTTVHAAGVIWSFVQHPSRLSENHYRSWIGDGPHRKRADAAAGVRLALGAGPPNARAENTTTPEEPAPRSSQPARARVAAQPGGLRATIREHLEEHPDLVRHGALGRDNVKMSDWRTRGGVVFAYENETGKLWAPDTSALRALASAIPCATYPKAELWTRTNRSGTRLYGRHSALKTIEELCGADLLRFAPTTLVDALRVLTTLHSM